MNFFSRKPKKQTQDYLLSIINKSIECETEQEPNFKHPIVRSSIMQTDLLKIPLPYRWIWYRFNDEQLRKFGIGIEEDEPKNYLPRLPPPIDPQKQLLSNPLVKDSPSLKSQILSETKEKNNDN